MSQYRPSQHNRYPSSVTTRGNSNRNSRGFPPHSQQRGNYGNRFVGNQNNNNNNNSNVPNSNNGNNRNNGNNGNNGNHNGRPWIYGKGKNKKVKKVMKLPMTMIFQFLRSRSRVQIWLVC